MVSCQSVFGPATVTDQNDALSTYFASAERLDEKEILSQNELFSKNEMLVMAFDAVPLTLVILNGQRQIIGSNSLTKKQFGDAPMTVLGKRPGEAFQCVHASSGPGGCGTGKACANCGAVKTIVESIDTCQKASGECCLELRASDGTVQCRELKVNVSPFKVDDEQFYSLILEDNSQNKRLEVFQRLFFHDILNTIGCIKGYIDIIQDNTENVSATTSDFEEPELISSLVGLCDQLHDEVNAHRQLVNAENGNLTVQRSTVVPQEILDVLTANYRNHEIGQGHVVTVSPSQCEEIDTDRILLMRILGNMTKNAIEASPTGSTITLSCHMDDGNVIFCVNNPGVIPENVRYQIFKRSFSTKQAVGRGIGTYSMRLLGEKYLGGKVDFISDEQSGTTFRLSLPVRSHES